MPAQPEQVVFPHVVPGPPDDEVEVFVWSRDMSVSLQELTRQIVDKYNRHILGSHSHPASWKSLKVARPSYEAKTAAGTTVTIPATAAQPGSFIIGEQRGTATSDGAKLIEFSSSLTCDLSTSGVGGLDTGSIAADTPYYLYGVDNDGSAGVIASATDPDTGPTGYNFGEWNYIGAVSTNGSSQFPTFQATGGRLRYSSEVQTVSDSSGSQVLASVSTLPVTAVFANFQCTVSGTVVNTAGEIASLASAVDSLGANLQVSGQSISAWGMVPIHTAQTIWLDSNSASNTVNAELYGWVEEPTRWP